jgi:hypothetical protein
MAAAQRLTPPRATPLMLRARTGLLQRRVARSSLLVACCKGAVFTRAVGQGALAAGSRLKVRRGVGPGGRAALGWALGLGLGVPTHIAARLGLQSLPLIAPGSGLSGIGVPLVPTRTPPQNPPAAKGALATVLSHYFLQAFPPDPSASSEARPLSHPLQLKGAGATVTILVAAVLSLGGVFGAVIGRGLSRSKPTLHRDPTPASLCVDYWPKAAESSVPSPKLAGVRKREFCPASGASGVLFCLGRRPMCAQPWTLAKPEAYGPGG